MYPGWCEFTAVEAVFVFNRLSCGLTLIHLEVHMALDDLFTDEITQAIYGDIVEETPLERWRRENTELLAQMELERIQSESPEGEDEDVPEGLSPEEILIQREERGEFVFSSRT